MALVFVTGGARSGKSSLAAAIARRQRAPVTFIATAQAGDEEMAERIRRHRAERPAAWRTIEEPIELSWALAAAGEDCVIVDCLSLWLANCMAAGIAADPAAVGSAAGRQALTIAVSNEVGMGVVPATPLGREYRDALGTLNAAWARSADQALFAVAGHALTLSDAASVVDRVG